MERLGLPPRHVRLVARQPAQLNLGIGLSESGELGLAAEILDDEQRRARQEPGQDERGLGDSEATTVKDVGRASARPTAATQGPQVRQYRS